MRRRSTSVIHGHQALRRARSRHRRVPAPAVPASLVRLVPSLLAVAHRSTSITRFLLPLLHRRPTPPLPPAVPVIRTTPTTLARIPTRLEPPISRLRKLLTLRVLFQPAIRSDL